MRREERLELLKLDKEADRIRSIQKNKSREQILEDIKLRERLRLSEDTIPIIEFFGKSAVYFLFKGEDLVYIGESKCVFSRIAQHLQQDIKEFTHFKIGKIIEDERLRKKSEKKLIKRFRPILNFTHNLGRLK